VVGGGTVAWMGRLGDVLEALYEAPANVQALHIRARHVVDDDAIVRVHDWWNRQREALDGSRSRLLITRSEVDADDGDDGIGYELWRAGAERWREDRGAMVTILDGVERLVYVPAMGGYRLPGGDRSSPPWSTLLHSRWVAQRCEIEIRGTDLVTGRQCWHLELQPIREPMPAIHNPFVMTPWLGTEHSCRVDQETGIVLAVEGRFEGAICSSWVTDVFELPETIDPAVFAFVPPDGKGWRSHMEFRVESMRRAGIDLTGVDVNDEHQLNEAMMQHHRAQFPAMLAHEPQPDPETLARQHIPTGPPPENVDAAEAQVRDAFEHMVTLSQDGAAVPAVQGGANLGPSLREARDRATAGANTQATVEVEHIKFLGPDEAVVWFKLLRDGHAVLGTMEGRAHRAGARWLVNRATFGQIVGSVGVRCPPPPET
jgi:hypothetical protein